MSIMDWAYYGKLYDDMKPKCKICKWDIKKHLKKYCGEFFCYQCAYNLYSATRKDLKKIKDEIKKYKMEQKKKSKNKE